MSPSFEYFTSQLKCTYYKNVSVGRYGSKLTVEESSWYQTEMRDEEIRDEGTSQKQKMAIRRLKRFRITRCLDNINLLTNLWSNYGMSVVLEAMIYIQYWYS